MPATGTVMTMSQLPIVMHCMHCNKQTQTVVTLEPGNCTWITCAICCLLLGVFSLCGAVAFMMDNLKDAHHRCQHCNNLVALREGQC